VSSVRRGVIIGIVFIAVAATAVGVTAAVTRTSESSGVSRVERAVRAAWGGSCDFDACGIGDAEFSYTTPTSVETVDLTVTITLRYRTSRGDAAFAHLGISDGATTEGMRPTTPYPLAPSVKATSTTLTWFKKDVPAAGAAYTFHFGAAPGFDPSGSSSVSGRKFTVVIESWTAGD
jgi:hypothetical protein